ncbi:Murein DD-endopeptidase MepM [Aquimixticola soesokkakensis]|uniref:Murein DD-endopeptidase MepM n=1 Tax=Aquimixticola soesokkakensis TaxID=1519096 RepID=A0A1Y5SN78_9RHOB|nr:M23 family metallopeptidase [Aquimixticola soesokkakensis]SLN44625.1 Murein DD-endopeptidase MepM [Aquimixticola soesokkakensis]
MTNLISRKLNHALSGAFPEQRLFLRSDADTRFVRLTPLTQLLGFAGSSVTVAWAIVATSVILMDSIGSGSVRDQVSRDQQLFETRIRELAGERDARASEAAAAQERFNTALAQISTMQSTLLQSEERVRELETGIDVVQSTLSRTLKERDSAEDTAAQYLAQIEGTDTGPKGVSQEDIESTVDMLTVALSATATQRDAMAAAAQDAEDLAADIALDKRLLEEKNERIFSQLEEAVTVSIEPLDKMFSAAGLSSKTLIDTVRQGYSGQGGPLMPISFSTRGGEPDLEAQRANAIISKMDELNLYRIAAQKVPLGTPLQTAFRFTSGFGPRWGRMHEGTDFAGAYGSPIYSTADGVVTFAGWSSGYGRLVKIQHAFGIETRYGHQSEIYVKVGQKVSRGDKIGAMGNSGQSTGTHLHYEVRVNGKAMNPMTYIKAANDVF